MTTATHRQTLQSVARRRTELTSALGTLLERIETDEQCEAVEDAAYEMSPAEVDAMLGMHRRLEALPSPGDAGPDGDDDEKSDHDVDDHADTTFPPADQLETLRRNSVFEVTPRKGSMMIALLVPALAAASIASAASWWSSRDDDSIDNSATIEETAEPAPLLADSIPPTSIPPTDLPPITTVSRPDSEIAAAVEDAMAGSGVVDARVSVTDGAVTVEAVAPVGLLADGYFARLGQLERLATVEGAAGVDVRLELRGNAATLRQSLQDLASISPILFDSGSAVIDESYAPVLDEVGEAIAAQPGLPVVIAGTTDASGSTSANEQLARARASAVMGELVMRGVPANRLQVVSYGELFADGGDDARSIRFEVGA